jgi:hypothetical protein
LELGPVPDYPCPEVQPPTPLTYSLPTWVNVPTCLHPKISSIHYYSSLCCQIYNQYR